MTEPLESETSVFRPLSFMAVTLDLPAQFPVVQLREFDAPFRRIDIPVGLAEGAAIAYAARDLATERPLTHELMMRVFAEYDIEVVTLRITAAHGGRFVGELVVSGRPGQRTVPCRVSDGIALCLRQRPQVPITASTEVLDDVGMPE